MRMPFIMFSLVLILSACTTAPKQDLALEQVKTALRQLQDDEELSGLAPLALGDAERALRQAEVSAASENQRIHLIYMADRRIQIARALAQRTQLENEHSELDTRRNQLLVRISQMEAAEARREAEQARLISLAREEETARANSLAEQAQMSQAESTRAAELAQQEAARAIELAEVSTQQAELARQEADLASQEADTLRRQLENMQLRRTESGVVLTLGDVLFNTGETQLRDAARANLDEVVDLLQSEPDKLIRIEGHTDSIGAADTNRQLSERRAQAVMDALVDQGVEADRMSVLGLGEDFPIATNDTPDGRSKNRRVDVILLDS